MRIAIPSGSDELLNSQIFGHFGHAPYFTIANVEDGAVSDAEAIKNVDHDENGCGGVIQYLLGQNFDVLIVAGMGQRPAMAFGQAGVPIYFDQQSTTVGEAVERYLAGQLPQLSLDDACNHH